MRIEMRRMLAMPLAIVTALVFAGPGLAQTSTPPVSPSTAPTEASKSGSAKRPHLRHVAAEVVSVDTSARTLVVKKLDKPGGEMKLTVDSTAQGHLAGLKPGDRVTVGYASEKGQLVARSIAPTAHTAQK